MSNHARGLWGYSGETADGTALTIQATGMGGPSAAIVLADLAELGVRRAVRVGTCAALGEAAPELGTVLVVGAARAEGASAAPFGLSPGEEAEPDADLTARLCHRLENAPTPVTVASFDTIALDSLERSGATFADMQTATVFACGASLDMKVAGVVIVEAALSGEKIADEDLEGAAKLAGRAAAGVL
jgi:uridine phosphorylase